MGEFVFGAATVHAPQMLTRPPQEDPAQLDAGIAAMRDLGKLLDETKPDVLLFLGIDHVETFFPNSVPTFAMVTGERATASYAGHHYDLPIHQSMAKALLDGLVSAGMDLTYTPEAILGHAFAVPFELLSKDKLLLHVSPFGVDIKEEIYDPMDASVSITLMTCPGEG